MKKLKYNIALAAIFFIGTFLNQEVFYLLNESLDSTIKPEKYAITFAIFFLFTFIKNRKARFSALSFIVILNLFQMSHIAYYGTPAQASEVLLFFAEAFEVYGTLKEELHLLIMPFVLTVIPLAIFWFSNNRMDQRLKKAPVVGWLFALYLVYNPVRTFVTGNTWGRQPSSEELGGMNIYLSASYFLGRILPAKINGGISAPPQAVAFRKAEAFDGDVILVLGESVTSSHMSLFGYKRPTTPLLEAMKEDPAFHYQKGISAGVSTDIAIAFLMNATYGLGGGPVVYKASQCLFRLAKDSGFKTHFISSQSQQQLRYISNSICPSYIDNYRSLDQIDPEIEDANAADDMSLLSEIDMPEDERHFVILHQRGSHSPYNLRYPKEETIFPVNEDPSKARVDHYDNSVYQLDKFMGRLIEKVKQRKRPAIVVYVSDHGEGLGEMGAWGHGKLVRPSYEIPIMVYSHMTENFKPFTGVPTHFNVSLMLAEFLGHKGPQDYSAPVKDYIILGNDIDGFAGRLSIKFDGLDIIEEKLLRDL